MTKIIYYIKIILFILYLICMFLLIDKVLTINTLGTIHFILSIIYSMLVILSLLSKKEVFITAMSYNMLNISLYIYTFVMSYMAFISTKLDIMNNGLYYRNNLILLIFMLVLNILTTIYLNKKDI